MTGLIRKSFFLLLAIFPYSSVIAIESSKAVFFKATVDKQQVYIQQQVLLTVKIFKEKNPPGIQFSGPLIEDAIVEKILEDVVYSETLNERKYLVREKSYVVFPQKSGLLKIVNKLRTPNDLTIKRHTPSNWAYDGNLLPSYIEKNIQLDVKPKPSIPSSTWLPSKQVLLEHSGIKSGGIWKINEPITWEITLSAQGLSENQLPKITLPHVDGIDSYLESSTKTREINSLGIVGKRKFRFTVIPNKMGKLTLPIVKIKWWNTRTNQPEVSRTKEQQLLVTQIE